MSQWTRKRHRLKKGLRGVVRVSRVFAVLIKRREFGHLRQLFKMVIVRALRELNTVLVLFETAVDRLENKGQGQDQLALKMRARIFGLHSLLPPDPKFTYSVLIPVYRPDPSYFEAAVRSALLQTAPHLEVLLGFDGPQPTAVVDVVERLKKDPSLDTSQLRVVQVDREKTGGGISQTTNALAREARGNFLLLMDHDDWMQADLLYRYEQTMRLLRDPEKFVLYCNEHKIDEKGVMIVGSEVIKPEQPNFPYVFINYICHCLLVPKTLWVEVGGLRKECDGAQDFDLCLRLDLVGAQFQNVPFDLYGWRAHPNSTALSVGAKDYATQAGIRALREYSERKGLNWTIQKGFFPTSYRALPPLRNDYPVLVVIPYKDQKSLTLAAVESVLNQKGVNIRLTLVDNGSDDRSVAHDLETLGAEVIRVDEAFNFSRLCNLGVKGSRYLDEIQAILFLNNDVELDPDAMAEMVRWVDQPQVGLVGARLHYPNGLIQHGGVSLDLNCPANRMGWVHHDCEQTFENSGYARTLGVCDAVTGACMLISKDVFFQVGGFDEVWYPVAFSDTDLAIRVRKLGLYALYTPYAHGVHHESASRGVGMWELPEASFWMFRNTEVRGQLKAQLEHQVFFR